jgi:hypothetical protein
MRSRQSRAIGLGQDMASTVREKREFIISHCVLPYHDRINADPVAEPQCAVYLLDAASSMTFATLSG